MTIPEALDLYPAVLHYTEGKPYDYTLLRAAITRRVVEDHLDANTNLPLLAVCGEVYATLAAAYWDVTRI
jgi:hypothetical protein